MWNYFHSRRNLRLSSIGNNIYFIGDPICYTLKQLQNPLQKLPAAEKDTKNSHPSHSRQQGHLAWDSFYDPSEIRTLKPDSHLL